jgi:hypothetical protein
MWHLSSRTPLTKSLHCPTVVPLFKNSPNKVPPLSHYGTSLQITNNTILLVPLNMFVCAFIGVFYLNFRPQRRRYVGCLQLDLCQAVLLLPSVQTARVISHLVKRACQNRLRIDFTITYRTENIISFLSY